MRIKELFQKDIEREIQGVVVVDEKEEAKAEQELEEFVVTEEMEKHLDTFFKAYNQAYKQPTDKIGVWISGFFGSGKSHFLKILSYLLDSNKIVAGKRPVDYFEHKLQNPIVMQKMKDALENHTDVVLFNIDSKAGANTKQRKLAVVKVFNKVFDEYRGYSPSIPWIAHLEETLDNKGQYEAFKHSFEEKAGLIWEEGRDEVFYNEDEMIEALVEATDMSEESARHWITTGEDNYDVSVDSFARRVKKYVDQQDPGYRLVFMADEMGQYISDNKDLMVELQTVAEDIGRYTKGQVWVVVTSQQNIDNLENDLSSSNDFSKIQGRFPTRLSLSSANADEVIKKRLLSKNDTAKQTLQITYDERMQAALRNKISFSDDTATLKQFDTTEDFVDFYPFVPYQITLLQKVLEEIRKHGLAGSSVSTGERNLLGTIQLAVLQYTDKPVGALVPFQSFFANLDASLDYSIQSTIIKAQQNASLNNFDVEVLKLLFLIRYIKEVPTNIENITTLMIDQLDEDKLEASKQVEASLKRLVKEYLVQRNGAEYVFLTNEEQDINREIQNMEVPTANLLNQIGEVIYSDILDLKKYTHFPIQNKKGVSYNFDVARWIDDRVISNANAEIGVRIITPYSDVYQNLEGILQLSSRENQVIVELDSTGTFYEDMLNIMKIDQYLRVNSSRKRTDLEQDILNRKARERNELTATIQVQLRNALQHAHVYVYGSEVEVSGTNATSIINSGLHQLVTNIYRHLDYIREFHERSDFRSVIDEDDIELLGIDSNDENYLATETIQQYIQRQTERKITFTIFNLIQEFQIKPYGWRAEDILVSIIRLVKAEKIILNANHQTIDLQDPTLERRLMNRDTQERTLVQKREVIDERILREVKQLFKDLFGTNLIEDKEDKIAEEFRKKLERKQMELNSLLGKYQEHFYPGKEEINQYLVDITRVLQIHDTLEFIQAIYRAAMDLRDDAEEIIDVQTFFEYSQGIYDEAYKIRKRFKDDQSMIQLEETLQAGNEIQDIIKMARPYKRLKDLPELVRQYKDSLSKELDREIVPLMSERTNKEQILLDSVQADEEVKQQFAHSIRNRFDALKQKLDRANTLKDLSAAKSEIGFITDQLSNQINRYQHELAEKRRKEIEAKEKEQQEKEKAYPGEKVLIDPIIHEQQPVLVHVDQLIPSDSYTIRNEAQLNKLMEEVQRKLKKELTENKYIQFI